MRTSLRILHVGNFGYKGNFRNFYSCDYKLYSGLLRGGHSVLQFSNRDIVRQEGFFKSRFGSDGAQNAKLLSTVREVRPDMVLIGHAEQITNDTLHHLREEVAGLRIAAFNVDALWVPHNLRNVAERSKAVDALFITTAGEALRQFSRGGLRVAFMPNPVDASIDRYRCFDNPAPECDAFFAGTASGKDSYRYAACAYLRAELPEARFNLIHDGRRLYGQRYLDELVKCRMGLNLPQYEEEAYQPYLYSSDRIAQYFGNGLLTFVHRRTGYADWLEEGVEAEYFSSHEELAEKMRRALKDDAAARRMAENGWRKYHVQYDAARVAQYVVEVTFGDTPGGEYAWPVDVY